MFFLNFAPSKKGKYHYYPNLMSEEEKKESKPLEPDIKAGVTDFEILHYSIDQEGNWNRKMLANWGAKEIVNTQTWIIVQERLNEAKRKVISGEMSPIGFFMVKCIMDVKLCAQFTGFSRFSIKKHMKPSVFKKLKPEILNRYAEIFEITVDELKTLEEKLKQEPKNEV
jgi:hypothetical protein